MRLGNKNYKMEEDGHTNSIKIVEMVFARESDDDSLFYE